MYSYGSCASGAIFYGLAKRLEKGIALAHPDVVGPISEADRWFMPGTNLDDGMDEYEEPLGSVESGDGGHFKASFLTERCGTARRA